MRTDDADDGSWPSPPKGPSPRGLLLRQSLAFLLLGLINNVLYVLVLSAALDLVPAGTPKGLVALANIAPALLAKAAWPYASRGAVRYARRIAACCALSAAGMLVVAAYDTLGARLLGIALASFASGLGELTYLQLCTLYRPRGRAVGAFAAGTGAAGLVGAGMWWFLRALGVRAGVGASAVLPFVIPAVYAWVLPPPAAFADVDDGDAAEYAPLAADADADAAAEAPAPAATLSTADKLRLARPLVLPYMLPLFCVYLFEYTINQGVAPTLVFPVPARSRLIHSLRDYYPLWQLVYQTTVCASRSTLTLGLPPLPRRLLAAPAVIQGGILLVLALASARGLLGDAGPAPFGAVFALIALEGVCGGLAYVNVFFRVNEMRAAPHAREFMIGSIGLADSAGILAAALLAMPVELGLCAAQVARGRTLCREL